MVQGNQKFLKGNQNVRNRTQYKEILEFLESLVLSTRESCQIPLYTIQGKQFLNFDNVPVKIYLNKLHFNLIPKFLVDFYRKIFTK